MLPDVCVEVRQPASRLGIQGIARFHPCGSSARCAVSRSPLKAPAMTLSFFAAAASVGSGVVCLLAWLTWRRRLARQALYLGIATGITFFLVSCTPLIER